MCDTVQIMPNHTFKLLVSFLPSRRFHEYRNLTCVNTDERDINFVSTEIIFNYLMAVNLTANRYFGINTVSFCVKQAPPKTHVQIMGQYHFLTVPLLCNYLLEMRLQSFHFYC